VAANVASLSSDAKQVPERATDSCAPSAVIISLPHSVLMSALRHSVFENSPAFLTLVYGAHDVRVPIGTTEAFTGLVPFCRS